MGDYQFNLLELNKFIFPTKNYRRTEVRIELPKEIVFIRELQQENNTLINEPQNLKAKKKISLRLEYIKLKAFN